MYKACIKLPATISEAEIQNITKVLAEEAGAFCALKEESKDTSPWVLEWYMEEKPDKKSMTGKLSLLTDMNKLTVNDNDWEIEKIPEVDWLAHSYKQFPPFSVGPFFVYGSHYEGSAPAGQTGLQIDAATAFGSGEHETTKGCLQAMLHLKEIGVCPWNILDMGTGSGILAIAAWKLWKAPVLAVDNDEESVRVAKHHCEINKAPTKGTGLTCAHGDGFKANAVRKKKPYELIIANILAGTLIEMADDLTKVLDDNGYIVLSGILNEQVDSVLSVYESYDLILKNSFEIGHWTTLVLHNPPQL